MGRLWNKWLMPALFAVILFSYICCNLKYLI